jgi:cysteinyl-tRNA synthetase
MKIYNTLARALETFEPIEPGHARLYTCGPTVYDYAHIGNFRAYIFEDLLRRTLRYEGLRVTQVMNLTDVDDKTIRGARAQGVALDAFTRPFKQAFFEDLDTLNIERAEHYPAATEHIPEMIALIERLFAKGYAYRSEEGSVYFNIARFANYGRLQRLNATAMRSGARVALDEYDKENASDFALWKAWDPEDGAVVWDSPWGRGRPGWHIECSAMSMKYLGESFDLHTGGVDNIFPHHENEIAQSEAVSGRPFARYWMHCAHLGVEGRKMSKSLGNFHTLRDLRERGYSGREVRYVLLSAHYRQALNFTFAALDGARAALARLDALAERLRERAGAAAPPAASPDWAAALHGRFRAALADDLGVADALAALFDLARECNSRLDRGEIAAAQAAGLLAQLDDMDRVLGFLNADSAADAPDEETQTLIRLRQEARAARQWAEADRLRDEIAQRGWVLKDTPNGVKAVRGGAEKRP